MSKSPFRQNFHVFLNFTLFVLQECTSHSKGKGKLKKEDFGKGMT